MIPLTIAESARLLERRDISATELTQTCLARIEALDGQLSAFARVTPELALARAAAADARAGAGTRRGPLDGIPIAHKDNFATADTVTTAHSALLDGWRPEKDASVVARLAHAGCVSLGKLTCYEFAFGGPAFDLPSPPARNPWDTDRTTAGSSNGSAAAVAAGLVFGATGSDTGGSVRDPAALCGIVGFKPTYRRISREGLLPFAWSLDTPGFLTRTAEDAALLLDAVADGVTNDPTFALAPPPHATATLNDGIAGLRIGVIRQFHEEEAKVAPAVQVAIDTAIRVLCDLGAVVAEVVLPSLEAFHACGWVIALAELHAAHDPWLRNGDGGSRYGAHMREGLAVGANLSAADYIRALRDREELRRQTLHAMTGFDLLLTGMQEDEAPSIREDSRSLPFEKPNLSMPFNVTGQPAISLCCGFGPHGLPLALQLIARPFDEALLLRAAHAYQQATRWHHHRPPMTVQGV